MMTMTPDELAAVLGTFAAEIRQDIRKETKVIEVNIRHEVLANQLKTQHELMEVQKKLRHDLAKIRHDIQTQAHGIEMSQKVLNDKLESLTKEVSATGDKTCELLLSLEEEEESDSFGENSAIRDWTAWIHDLLLGEWPDEAR
ncbi:hypothetical protein T069G_02517 [Trichoderma breve]|uniref:Uncharacterized protein n=1 Tax=Trichoderma breve TaxID=2034170 RepID=A0A9W9BE03_9HYPO|nr:hypothetical protein T069G_02517 [Trichoderma breve]KAJ4861563.1 hypothetical protein T069G_02517 [Trichoderma breve]